MSTRETPPPPVWPENLDEAALREKLAQDELVKRLVRESRRSALLGFVGGIVIMGSLVGAYVSVVQYRKSNASLQTDLTKTTAVATQANQAAQAATSKSVAVQGVLNATVADLQSKGGQVSATTTAALDHAFDVNPAAAKLLVRVYIHAHSAAQSTRAAEIAHGLRSAGFLVPGVDVQPQTYRQTEIHYYTDDPQTLADVDAIAKAAAGMGIPVIKRKVAPSAGSPVRPRAYGFWLAADLQ